MQNPNCNTLVQAFSIFSILTTKGVYQVPELQHIPGRHRIFCSLTNQRDDNPASPSSTSHNTAALLMGELIIIPLSQLKCLESFFLLMPGASRITKPNTRLSLSYINEITQPCFSENVCHQIYMKDLVPYLTRHDNLTWCFPLWQHDHKHINKSRSVINNRCRIPSVDKSHQVFGPYMFSTTSKSHCSQNCLSNCSQKICLP